MRAPLAAALAWLALSASSAPAAGEGGETAPPSPRLELAVDSGSLTLRAEAVPLGEVLAAIGARAGFEVSVRGAVERPVTVVLTEVPIEAGLRQLLGSGSLLFAYDPPDGGPERRLVEVRALVAEAAPPLRSTPVGRHDQPESAGDAPLPAISPYDPLEARLEFARAARRGRPQAPEELETLLLEDEHAHVRGLAAAALGRRGGAAAGEALVEALSDRDWRVRRRAARALGDAWGDQAVEPLADLLAEERSRSVRRVAAYALSRVHSEAANEALAALRYDRDPSVRRIAAVALAPAGD